MIEISVALRRGLLLLGTTLALLIMVPVVVGTAPARALPPTGASPNTPGTSSVLNASSYQAGDKISFKVRGFPAGETINVKIDDGQECGKAAVHGACVVYKQRISKGTTVGSFRLPTDLKAGSHWLRFLASEEIEGGGGGTKGYSNRSPDFTIKAAATKSSTTSKGSTSTGPSSKGSKNSSTSDNNESSTSTSTGPTTGASTRASPTPSASETPSAKPSKKAKKKAKREKQAKESTRPAATATDADPGLVTPEPVTAVVTGAGLSVAQALAVGGGAVGLAAVVGGLTAWWRRGGQ